MHQIEQVVERTWNKTFQVGVGKRWLVLKTKKNANVLVPCALNVIICCSLQLIMYSEASDDSEFINSRVEKQTLEDVVTTISHRLHTIPPPRNGVFYFRIAAVAAISSKHWGTTWRARGARAYNGGLGAEPPAGSTGRAPGQGVRGRSPPEAERKLNFDNTITRLILH